MAYIIKKNGVLNVKRCIKYRITPHVLPPYCVILFTNKNVKGGFVFAQHKVDLGPL